MRFGEKISIYECFVYLKTWKCLTAACHIGMKALKRKEVCLMLDANRMLFKCRLGGNKRKNIYEAFRNPWQKTQCTTAKFLYSLKFYVVPWHRLASWVPHNLAGYTTPTPMGKKSPLGNCSMISCVCSSRSWVCGFHSPGSPLHDWHGLQESLSFCGRMGLLCENHQVYCYKFFLLLSCHSFCSFVDYPFLWGL